MRKAFPQARDEEETTKEAALEAKKNYIPSSDRARREYAYVLMKEYRTFLASRANDR